MAKAGGGPGRPRSVEAQAKAKKASEMRIAGMTWDQIAEEVGYKTESGARLAVRRYFEKGAHDVFDRMHPILNGRAEMLWRKAWARVNRAQTVDEWDRAMRQCANIVMMQARMNGCIDQKVQVEVSMKQQQSVKDLQAQFHQLQVLEGGKGRELEPPRAEEA
ncbi:terminase small subunit [Gordonia phage Soos]|nr:terminase small subunit [Gordonia phage Soos]